MAHTRYEIIEIIEIQHETKVTKAKMVNSRDQMSMLEDKVERLRDNTRGAIERLDVMDDCLDKLETKRDELKDEFNLVVNREVKDVEKKGDVFQVALVALREEMQAKIEKLEIECVV
ncbi:hypothetical protein V6N12_058204 [Hibiscus sabdariffa]|uniref:Uncharacterized protein n=1 Tax=Hibiscus sabdariffa TaxID=183260 RepID=A0ABR2ERX3_9ROSI